MRSGGQIPKLRDRAYLPGWRGVLQGVFPQLLHAGGSSPAMGRWQVARASAEKAAGRLPRLSLPDIP